jgi:predicted outer membrane repeat protein
VWTSGAGVAHIRPAISDCRVHHNTATTGGGGIYAKDAEGAALSGDEVYLNEAGEGGGIYVSLGPTTTLVSSHVYANSADYGAGVYLNSSPGTTMSEGYVYDSTAVGLGGELWIGGSRDVALRNSIIADNDVTGTGTGVGAFLFLDSTARLLHTTLAQYNAPAGHALALEDGVTAWMTNTIVASNTVGIYVGTGRSATMEATLWGEGPWANPTNWISDRFIDHG